MREKNHIVDGLEINYEGIFELDELLKAIDKNTSEKGYTKYEVRREELVTEKGKEFYIQLEPKKSKSEYYDLILKIRIRITNLKDQEVIKNNVKKRLQKGKINIILDAWVFTDYQSRHQQNPTFYFFRSLYDKYAKKPIHSKKHYGEVSEDCHYVYHNIKSHLALYKV